MLPAPRRGGDLSSCRRRAMGGRMTDGPSRLFGLSFGLISRERRRLPLGRPAGLQQQTLPFRCAGSESGDAHLVPGLESGDARLVQGPRVLQPDFEFRDAPLQLRATRARPIVSRRLRHQEETSARST